MRYVLAVYKEKQTAEAYRIYIADSLYYAGQNMHLTARWTDLINKKVDVRTGDEIAADVINKCGLKLSAQEEEIL